MTQVQLVLDRDIYEEAIHQLSQKATIIDMGARKRFHKRLAPHKHLFKGVHYFAWDIMFNPELDGVADIQAMPFPTQSIEGFLCYGVLQFAEQPDVAMAEIYRCLKTSGLLFAYVPFLYPYHGDERLKDRYRFSKDAVVYLFRHFRKVTIQPLDNYLEVVLRYLTGFRFGRFTWLTRHFENCTAWLLRRSPRLFRGNNTTAFHILAEK